MAEKAGLGWLPVLLGERAGVDRRVLWRGHPFRVLIGRVLGA